ncbi:lamin tail domain-containing protein [Faecalibacter rhinopitheci]|uniref:Lamin tail domain-containing protein n=1 Tax=Faecalibacter rhinopitheci TaxID=2779678 RepID=A0A8J7KIN3_9FLAO|nr:lamin tail domain-containing protein [Faecalibacter rhinopitheci]MBF0598101.1 lamin tail domain-containing protein [Faecalibacter rhinopitheci]
MKLNLCYKYLFTILFLLLLSARGYGQENITPIRDQVTGFPIWTDNQISGSTYLQLLKNNSYTITPTLDLSQFTNKTLDFKFRTYGVATASEILLTISISEDNGNTWKIIRTLSPSKNNLNSAPQILLNQYSNSNSKIKFSVGGNNDDIGVGIDDISIRGNLITFQEAPILTTPQLVSGTYGVLLTNYTVQNTGGSATGWSVDHLPNGVAFTNGVFSGTPMFTTPFSTSVTASNSLGSSTASINFNIAKAKQTFGLPTITNKFVDDANVTLPSKTKHSTNSALDANDITYTSNNPSVVAIVNGNQLDFLSVGSAEITATSANTNSNYDDITSAKFTVSVKKRTQTISNFSNITQTYGGTIGNLAATTNSSLPLSYEIVSGQPIDVISITGNQVTILNVGSTKIRAFNNGNDIYSPIEKTIDVKINKANQTLLTDISNISGSLGLELDTNLDYTNQNLPLTVVSDNEEVAFYNEGKIYLVGIGTTTLKISNSGNRNYEPYEKTINVKVLDPDLNECINENFDGTDSPKLEQQGWELNSITFGGQTCTGKGAVFNGKNDYLRTPVLLNPQEISFNKRRSGSTTAWKMIVQIRKANSNTEQWSDVKIITSISTSCEEEIIDLKSIVEDGELYYIRLIDDRSSENHERTIDNLKIICKGEQIELVNEPPVVKPASKVSDNQFQANWEEVSNNSYLLDIFYKELGNYTTDLIFSEYVEGSSFNKALEIYNGTGNSINLRGYKISKQSNGVGNFTNTYSLPERILNHGETILLIHGNAGEYLYNLSTNHNSIVVTTPVSFNGNDAIILTKNGVTIDQVGFEDQVSTWGENKTLRRKSTANANPEFSIAEWDEYPIDTFDGLGHHSVIGLSNERKVYVKQDEIISKGVFNHEISTGISKNSDYYYVVRSQLGDQISAPSEEMDVKRTYFENGFWKSDREPGHKYHSVVLEGNFDGSLKGKSITIDNETTNTITSGNTFHAVHSFDVLSGAIVFDEGAYLLQDNDASVNYGEATFKRNATFFRYDSKVWSSPVNGQKIVKSSATDHTGFILNPSKIFSYNEPTRNWLEDTDANFMTAKAYAIQLNKGYPNYSEGGTQVNFEGLFKGTPQNGVYTVPVKISSDGRGDNGVGNPYGSPIAMENFMSVNHHVKTLYFWNEEAHYDFSISGYNAQTWNAYNLTGNNNQTSTESSFINTGVGFITRVTTDGDIIFNNSMREVPNTNLTIENRVKLEKDRFWLRLTENDKKLNQILIGYIPGATNEIDDKYDAKNLSMQGSYILSNTLGNKMIIEGRQYPLDNNDSIPLFFKASEAGQFTIDLALKEGIFNEENIYLRDNLENKIINLTEDNSYSFHSDKGDFPDRFMIQYKENQILNAVDLASANGITIYQNRTIYQVQSNELVNAYKVLNFNGDIIQKVKVGAKNQFDLIALNSGVYFIQFSVQSGKVITKKMIIK